MSERRALPWSRFLSGLAQQAYLDHRSARQAICCMPTTKEVGMIWAIVIVGVVLLAIGLNEWRTRKKPLVPGMREWEKGKHNNLGTGQ